MGSIFNGKKVVTLLAIVFVMVLGSGVLLAIPRHLPRTSVLNVEASYDHTLSSVIAAGLNNLSDAQKRIPLGKFAALETNPYALGIEDYLRTA